MPLEPIRWDNVALPQFNNSALAVASGAFSGSAADAAALAEAFQKKEQERRALIGQDLLNQAISRMYADGQATDADLRGLPAGVDMGKVTEAFRALGIHNADIAEIGARTDSYNADTAFNRARTLTHPAESQAEIEERNAAAAASKAAAATQNARTAQIGEERSDAQRVRDNLTRVTTGVQNINRLLHGTGEGTLAGEAEALFPQYRQKLLTDAATAAGVPIEALPPEAIEKIDTLGRDQFIKDHITNRMSDERFLSELVNTSGLTEDEIKTYSAFGKDVAASQASLRELNLKTAEEERKLGEKQKEYITNAKAENYENVVYDGTAMTFGEKNPISTGDMEAEAVRLGLDPKDPRLGQLKRQFPHRQAFRNALTATTKIQTSVFGNADEEGKREFTDDFNTKLGALIDQRDTTISRATATPDKIQSGTPEENLTNYVRAALSGVPGKKEESAAESITPEAAAKKKVAELGASITAAQAELDDVVGTLPKSLQTPDVEQELQKVMEAVRGTWTDLSKPIVSKTDASVSYAEVPLTPDEIVTRLQAWKGFLPVLKQRIERAQISEAEKDELQKFFDQYNAKK